MMNAVAMRPTPEAQPKPEARALVGNTSDTKICIAFPATWTKNTMMNPATRSMTSVAAFANTIAITPAATKAQTEVTFRPMLSSAYIMKMLAHGTAKFIASVYWSDFVMVKPLSNMMLGSQAPSPMAKPKKAVKQTMPATTRIGYILNTTANGSLLVSLAMSVLSGAVGPEIPSRLSTAIASSPRPCVAR